MKGDTLVKVVAIVCLTAIAIVDMLTVKIDSAVIATLMSIIAGIAGYHLGKSRSESKGGGGSE